VVCANSPFLYSFGCIKRTKNEPILVLYVEKIKMCQLKTTILHFKVTKH
jgi:hypothetical protein